MSVIHFHAATTSTPEQFIAGLTDFGPDRSKIFTNSADAYLTVHSEGTWPRRRHRGLGGTVKLVSREGAVGQDRRS